MRILDRYIGVAVIGGTLPVLAGLFALFSFLAFVGEQTHGRSGGYSLIASIPAVVFTQPSLA